MGVSYALLPLLAGDGVAVTWAPALAGGAVGLAVAHRRRSPRCTRRSTPAASTRPSRCARSEAGRRDAAHHRPQQPAPPQGPRRVPGRRPAHRRRHRGGAHLAHPVHDRADEGQPAELRRQHRRHAAQQGRDAELRRHHRRRRLRRGAVAVPRPTSRASTPSRAAPSISVVAPELVGAVQVKGHRALLHGRAARQQQFKLKRWWSVGSGHAADQRPRARGRLRGRADARPHDGRLRAHRRPPLHGHRRPAARPARRTTACSSPTSAPSSRCCAGPAR